MAKKVFQVRVELELEAVTCPGVWLCTNGSVSLHVYMLDSCIETKRMSPAFPLTLQETYVFWKQFEEIRRLTDVQRELCKETVYIELIQWRDDGDVGNVLATFETCLKDVLYPCLKDGTLALGELDLLMDPAKHFPGIIAPKLQVCTRTTIQEKVKNGNGDDTNAKLISSNGRKGLKKHQRKVCHSLGNSYQSTLCSEKRRSRCKTKPDFVVRRVSDNLLGRKPQSLSPNICYNARRSRSKPLSEILESEDEAFSSKTTSCSKRYKHTIRSDWKHSRSSCSMCSRYKDYFEKNPPPKIPRSSMMSEGSNTPGLCKCRQCEHKDKKICYCEHQPDRRSQSTAQKLHKRLKKTLNTLADNVRDCRDFASNIRKDGFPIVCVCGNTSSEDVIENFDKFYKDLRHYNRNLRGNTDKYVSSCC